MARGRKIVVDGEEYRWVFSVPKKGGTSERRRTLLVRGVSNGARYRAVFRVVRVENLWGGAVQDVVITPKVVAEIVRRCPDGGVLEHAEQVLLDLPPFDKADAELAAACAQWFVPYPGRAAIARALAEANGDAELAARALSTHEGMYSAEQITRWAGILAIG